MADPKPTCPICRKPTEPRFRPFCSVRCADVDLGRWFTESYAVPVAAPESDEDDNLKG
ncbi:MAG: DNA gyrase inhibitor YacG [Alphaproteobacteria bacterium]|nr:DNA gyrase inhibitor YacG [Alphaproteobacteria bacterium]